MLPFLTETETVWQRLARTEKPIVLYGMGLGAEKILFQLAQVGTQPAAVFASDEFIRGHRFHEWPVQRLADIKAQYPDFFIVVAFAFWQPELLARVQALAKQYELVLPHLPVVGNEAVTPAWIQAHEPEIAAAWRLLADEQSRRVFAAVMNYKLSGRIEGLRAVTTPKAEAWQLLQVTRQEAYLDLGAYDGDTLRELIAQTGGLPKRMVALEPDAKNFRKLCAYLDTLPAGAVQAHQAGVYSADTTLLFANRAGRHSAVARDGQGVLTPMRSIDSLAAGERFTLIKLDVEGEEAQAIAGAQEQLRRFAPKLMVSAYHRNEDTFALLNQIHAIQPRYRFYLRQHPYLPAWDNNLYCIPEEQL